MANAAGSDPHPNLVWRNRCERDVLDAQRIADRAKDGTAFDYGEHLNVAESRMAELSICYLRRGTLTSSPTGWPRRPHMDRESLSGKHRIPTMITTVNVTVNL